MFLLGSAQTAKEEEERHAHQLPSGLLATAVGEQNVRPLWCVQTPSFSSFGLFLPPQTVSISFPFSRQRIGMDPAIMTHLLSGEGGNPFGAAAERAAVNAAAQRFHHILHLCASSGEHEKLTQVLGPDLGKRWKGVELPRLEGG